MNRKTFTFEELENMYSGLVNLDLYAVGNKQHQFTFRNETTQNNLRILCLRGNFYPDDHFYCILDNQTVAELEEYEVDKLLFAYQSCHYSRDPRLLSEELYLGMTDFEKQEADKLYIELSGHEPADSYEWLEWPYGTQLHDPIGFTEYFYSN